MILYIVVMVSSHVTMMFDKFSSATQHDAYSKKKVLGGATFDAAVVIGVYYITTRCILDTHFSSPYPHPGMPQLRAAIQA